MRPLRWLGRGVWLLLVAATTPSPVPGWAQSLTLKEAVPLIADQSGNAVATFTLANDGNDPAPVRLNLSDFSHRPPDGRAAYPLGTTRTLAAVSDKDKPILDGVSPLAAGGTLEVRITVAKLWEAGESEAALKNGGADIPVRGGPPKSVLKALRLPSAYNVQIVSATPDAPEIHVIGDSALVGFKNADPSTYRFTWTLRLDGHLYDGGPSFIDLPPGATQWVRLARKDAKSDFPRASWLTAGTLKDDLRKGDLILEPVFAGATAIPPLAPKILPATFRFSYWGPNVQQLCNAVGIFLLLMAGGLGSIGIHHGIPNATRALALKRRLEELGAKIQGLGVTIESRRRVMLETQLPAIRRQLASGLWFLPSFTATLDTVTTKVDMVQQWVEIAYRASVVIYRASEVSERVPATAYRWILGKCAAALTPIESGFTSPEEIAAMTADLKAAENYLDVSLAGLPNPDLEKEITEREARLAPLQADLAANYPPLAGLVSQMPTTGAPLTPVDYIDRDSVSLKVDLLRAFHRRVQQLAAAPGGAPIDALDRLKKRGPALMSYLAADTHESLRVAVLYVNEMRQDLYPDALEAALTQQPLAATVITHPPRIEVQSPVMLRVRFDRDILNEASARLEWKCLWNFGDSSPREVGWEVFHSYEEPGPRQVKVSLVDLDAKPVAPDVQLQAECTVLPVGRAPAGHWWSRWGWLSMSPETRLELARTSIVLALAMVGLMTTARQQVDSLSFLGAVSAIIVLGFGVDVVKNLAMSR